MAHWEELHHNSTLVDLHTHPALKAVTFDRDLSSPKRRLLSRFFERKFWPFSDRVTFPKMDKGGVDVLLSTSYILEQGWIDDIKLIKWLFRLFPSVRKSLVDPNYFDATNSMLDEMERQIDAYNDTRGDDARRAHFAGSVDSLNTGLANGDMCVVHSLEGGHCLHGDEAGKSLGDEIMSSTEEVETEILNNLEHLFNRGVAYLTLAHFYPNRIAYPVFPYPEYAMSHMNWKEALGKWDMNKGLTSTGEKVVEKMLELGMLIDICHCTPKGKSRILDIASHHKKGNCIIASHTGAFEIHRDPYNLTDKEIKWIGDNGGVIGIIFMNYWLSPIDSGLGLKHIEETMNHMINVGGSECIGIGTDYDGFTDPPDEISDLSELPRVTKYLASLEYTDLQIEGFLGANALRTLKNGWGKRDYGGFQYPTHHMTSGVTP